MIVTETRFLVRLRSRETLVHYMKWRGITIRELADRVGCSRSTIGKLTAGRTTYVRADWAKRIARCLDAPLDLLFAPEVSTVACEAGRKEQMPA